MRSRLCYAALWALAFPVLLFYLLYRSMAQSGYRKSLSERFARYDKTPLNPIWLHAASLGEVNAAAPLLVELRRDYPDVPLLISCQTPAGRQAASALTIDNCTCHYLPFDVRLLTQKFVARIQPRMALIFETEIWPNLFLSIKQAGVPLLMINARITERSVRRYAKLTGIFANALALADQIACQSDADAARFIEAGAKPESISVFGNIKWDKAPDEAVFKLAETLKSSWLQQPIWMAASTHSDEESVVLETHRKVLANWPNAMLLWAPRHPERFQPVCDLALALGFSISKRSVQGKPDKSSQVFVIDSLGELLPFMACADVVFVGGSLQNIGGHNVLEPAMLGIPILVGPYTQNFVEIVRVLEKSGALIEVPDEHRLHSELLSLLDDLPQARERGRKGLHAVLQNRGALQKTKALVAQRLSSAY